MNTTEVTERSVIRFPRWHEGQLRIINDTSRFRVAACGRRFGKSMLAQYRLAEPALRHGYPTAYFTPSYKLLSDTWRNVITRLAPAITKISATEKRIELATNGVIDFWTLEDRHAGRSRKYARVIVDEAGIVPHLESIWEESIRPTLTDYRGEGDFYGTPEGRNYFYTLHQRGLDELKPEWKSFQMPSSVNPYLPKGEIDAARESMTERRFMQEYLAMFLEEGGGVFRGVRGLATARALEKGVPGRQYAAGVDWGRENDATVFSVFDVMDKCQVYLDRMVSTDYHLQRMRLHAMAQAFPGVTILAEANSMGTPLIEQLQREGLYVMPFITGSNTKTPLIDALALAFERGTIAIIEDPILIAELEAYESRRTASGMISYGAPQGMHDDTVIATALAWWQIAGMYGVWSGGNM